MSLTNMIRTALRPKTQGSKDSPDLENLAFIKKFCDSADWEYKLAKDWGYRNEQYDQKGRLVERKAVTAKVGWYPSSELSEKFEYDSEGRLIKVDSFDYHSGRLEAQQTFRYRGKLIEKMTVSYEIEDVARLVISIYDASSGKLLAQRFSQPVKRETVERRSEEIGSGSSTLQLPSHT